MKIKIILSLMVVITYALTLNAKNVNITNSEKLNPQETESSYDSHFITTWSSFDGEITIPTNGTGYDYTIEWENLTNPSLTGGSASGITGDYTIRGLPSRHTIQVTIYGDFPHFYMNNNSLGSNSSELKTVENWGDINWQSMAHTFEGCSYLRINAEDTPNLGEVTNMDFMFAECRLFNDDISSWDVSNVTSMEGMFYRAERFNQDIGLWDVSNVSDMLLMFGFAEAFNQDISAWDVSNVTSMINMFRSAKSFNQDISTWDVSSVTMMSLMFLDANAFNQNLGNWDVSNVINMGAMLDRTAISVKNYDATLEGWSKLDEGEARIPLNIDFGANNLMYCNEKARNNLIRIYNWDITDAGEAADCSNFVTTWLSSDGSITVPTNGIGYNYTIEWKNLDNPELGGGSASGVTGDFTISDLPINNHIQVDISGYFPHFYMNNDVEGNNKNELLSIERWGDMAWSSMENAFEGCENMTYNAFDAPNLESVTSLNSMFKDCFQFNGDLGSWDISQIINMEYMLDNAGLSSKNYNETLIGWVQNSNTPQNITLGAQGLVYCGVPTILARFRLIRLKRWNIEGDEKCSLFSQFTKNEVIPYPNPAINSVTIPLEANEQFVRIQNTQGIQVKSFTTNSNTSNIVWDLTNSSGQRLQPGIYIISVESTNLPPKNYRVLVR